VRQAIFALAPDDGTPPPPPDRPARASIAQLRNGEHVLIGPDGERFGTLNYRARQNHTEAAIQLGRDDVVPPNCSALFDDRLPAASGRGPRATRAHAATATKPSARTSRAPRVAAESEQLLISPCVAGCVNQPSARCGGRAVIAVLVGWALGAPDRRRPRPPGGASCATSEALTGLAWFHVSLLRAEA